MNVVKRSPTCRISYCSADATFTHVFAFLAVNRAESLQCHAFLARKQKIVSCKAHFNSFGVVPPYALWQCNAILKRLGWRHVMLLIVNSI